MDIAIGIAVGAMQVVAISVFILAIAFAVAGTILIFTWLR